MKKITTSAALVLIVFCASLSIAAQLPSGLQAQGPDTESWVTFDLTGEITAFLTKDTIELDADGLTYTIYGVGPQWYWEDLFGESPLVVGATIAVSGYVIDHLGEERYVAVAITVDGTEVELRDEYTFVPMWTGRHKKE